MRVRYCVAVLMISLLIIMQPVFAVTDVEHADLARIHTVLASLAILINDAEREQERSDRLQFHYEWLRQDLVRIQQGIREKLTRSPMEPRHIMPITGDYLK